MRRRIALLALVLGAPLVAAGCGGGGATTGVFDVAGFGVTFEYPLKQFDIGFDLEFGSETGGNPAAQAGIVLDEDNAIIMLRYDLSVSITKDNLSKFKGEVDAVVARLAGKTVSGREVEHGGLPGYEYAIDLRRLAGGQSRIAVLFDADVEYFVNCQSTAAQRAALEDACRKALDTLARK